MFLVIVLTQFSMKGYKLLKIKLSQFLNAINEQLLLIMNSHYFPFSFDDILVVQLINTLGKNKNCQNQT